MVSSYLRIHTIRPVWVTISLLSDTTWTQIQTCREGGQVTSGSGSAGLAYDVKRHWSLWWAMEKGRESASTRGNAYVALTHVYTLAVNTEG